MTTTLPGIKEPISGRDVLMTNRWWSWFNTPSIRFTGTIVTAKLTGGGVNGSITIVNGVVQAVTPAT